MQQREADRLNIRNQDNSGNQGNNQQNNSSPNANAANQNQNNQQGDDQSKKLTRLSKGEIKTLQDNDVDPHDLKPKKGGSRFDLFKDRKGNIYVLPKNGKGEPDPTGHNINDYE